MKISFLEDPLTRIGMKTSRRTLYRDEAKARGTAVVIFVIGAALAAFTL